jgi:Abnormal spindle-like microcephaly-assoc'd, ASPM-SPD-2-Hydin
MLCPHLVMNEAGGFFCSTVLDRFVCLVDPRVMRVWLAAACLWSACSAPMQAPVDAGPVAVVIEPRVCLTMRDLDFGEVEPNQTATIDVRFTNASKEPTTLEFGRLLAPFRSSVTGKRSLAADESLDVRFSFTAFSDALERTGGFTLTGGDGCEPFVVLMRARSAGVVEVPTELDFGQVGLGQTATRTVSITSTRRSATTLQLRSAPVDGGSPFSVAAEIVVPPTSTVELTVVAQPSSPVSSEADVLITGPDARSRVLHLHVSGGVPQAALNRTMVDMGIIASTLVGTREIGHSFRYVWLHNLGDGPLELSSAPFEVVAAPGQPVTDSFVVTYDDYPRRPPLIAPGAKYGLILNVFTFDSPGPRSWRLLVHSNSPTEPVLEVGVVANVVSMVPCSNPLIPSPFLDVGAVPVGQSAGRSLVLENRQATECLVDVIPVFESGGWSAGPSEQAVLDGGGSVTLEFTFQPLVAGPDSQRFQLMFSGDQSFSNVTTTGVGF